MKRVRDFDQPAQTLETLSHVDALVIEEDAVNAGGAQSLNPPSAQKECQQVALDRILWRYGHGRRCIRGGSVRRTVSSRNRPGTGAARRLRQ